MLRYIASRLIWFVPTIIAMAAVTFILTKLTPGSPFALSNMQRVTPETIARFEKMYGLDKPVYEQFYLYLWNSAQGDFGESLVWRGQDVRDIIERTFPISLKLGSLALIVAMFFGITLGILAAVNQNGIIDYFSMTLAILFYSMPNFVLGFLMLLIFVVWLPNHGIDLGFHVGGLNAPIDWVLPTIALAAAPLAVLARYTRSSMLDVIRSDYVRTARAKGLARQKVVLKHVLKNALIPVITIIGPLFAAIGTGTFFVEQVFNIPGMGKFYVDSMQTKDQPMILAVTLIFGVFLAMMNLVVDVLYGVVDPRIRY